jgi:predicted HicB family RNase H-like nuclease
MNKDKHYGLKCFRLDEEVKKKLADLKLKKNLSYNQLLKELIKKYVNKNTL